MENGALIHACNYKTILLDGLRVNGKLTSLIKKWSDGNVILKDVTCDAKEDTVSATDTFFAHKV